MVCGPKIHLREGSPLPRVSEKMAESSQRGSWTGEPSFSVQGASLEAHIVILGSGKVSCSSSS